MNIVSKYLKDTSSIVKKTNYTVKTKKIDDLIFFNNKDKQDNLYKGDSYSLSNIEKQGNEKLDTFDNLTKDIFYSLYKNEVKRTEGEILTDKAKRFNLNIINNMVETDEFKALRDNTITNAEDSMEASNLLMNELLSDLDSYLKDIYDNQSEEAIKKYEDLIEQKKEQIQKEAMKYEDGVEMDYTKVQNKVKSLEQQIDGLKKIIDKGNNQVSDNVSINSKKIKDRLKESLIKVSEDLEVNKTLRSSFGFGIPKNNIEIDENNRLLKDLKKNTKILKLAKMLGNLKQIFKQKESSKYAKGRGEFVGIELGNSLERVLDSELALLANKETSIEFYKKFADDSLSLYKQAHKAPKGKGNCIIIGDESSSTLQSKNNEFAPYFFTKGLAISISQVLINQKRETVYIPFSGNVGEVININKDTFNPNTITRLATNFMGGGTNYNNPLEQTIDMIKKDLVKYSDIIFITDGESRIDDDLVIEFKELCRKKKIQCIGILLDYNNIVREKEVSKFCTKVMRVSELGFNGIASEVFNKIK